ncbi:MAG TPA: right-handed parallel beta-helix repeat-containing protein, partial [Spirochaetota bacterium]|nr:right-handed parallel beta-helix repeat-containing protein [Spirochaetota bacterium]
MQIKKNILLTILIFITGLVYAQSVTNITSGGSWSGSTAIQSAVDAGPAVNDILVVNPGSYDQVSAQNDGSGFTIISSNLYYNGEVKYDTIFNGNTGLMLQEQASNVTIAGFYFAGNGGEAIKFQHADADGVIIKSNIFSNCGRFIWDGGAATIGKSIYRNLFIRATASQGILLQGGGGAAQVYNNTFDLQSLGRDAIENQGTLRASNNIFINSGSAAGDYAILNAGTLTEGKNLISNCGGGVTGGADASDIQPSGDHRLNSGWEPAFGSAAIDSGVIITGIADTYTGSGPDMGWKETLSPVIASNTNTGATYTNTIHTINDAVTAMNNNETLIIYPGFHGLTGTLNLATGYVIQAKDWLENQDNTSTILSNNSNPGIYINNNHNVIVQGFSMYSSSGDAFKIGGTSTNISLLNCNFYSNNGDNVNINTSGASHIYIYSNNLWNANSRNIYVNNGD